MFSVSALETKEALLDGAQLLQEVNKFKSKT